MIGQELFKRVEKKTSYTEKVKFITRRKSLFTVSLSGSLVRDPIQQEQPVLPAGSARSSEQIRDTCSNRIFVALLLSISCLTPLDYHNHTSINYSFHCTENEFFKTNNVKTSSIKLCLKIRIFIVYGTKFWKFYM